MLFISCTFVDFEETGGAVQPWNGPSMAGNETTVAVGNDSARTTGFAQYRDEITGIVIEPIHRRERETARAPAGGGARRPKA